MAMVAHSQLTDSYTQSWLAELWKHYYEPVKTDAELLDEGQRFAAGGMFRPLTSSEREIILTINHPAVARRMRIGKLS